MKKLGLLIISCAFAMPAFAQAYHTADSAITVKLFDSNGEVTTEFQPFGDTYRGDASLASADLGKDGVPEIIIGSGHGFGPYVKVYRQDGSIIGEFLAYAKTYINGVNVTTCDVNGDNVNEIITGTMYGGGPHIRIFNEIGEPFGEGFFAYDSAFRGGVNVACGDVDNDGVDDIVTGAGITGGPHVKVFDQYGNMKYEIFTGSAHENTGIDVAVGDLDGDGDAEIITGRDGVGDSTIIVLDKIDDKLSFVLSLNAFQDYKNGLNVVAGDIDGDGMDEFGASTKSNGNGEIKFFEMTGAVAQTSSPFGEDFTHGITSTTVENGSPDHLLAMNTSPQTKDMMGQYILVDLSEQTLYAYENGTMARSFLISSGTKYYPTPTGEFSVTDKLLWHDYSWYYGAGDSRNYDLKDVKYNLRFKPSFYIHYAYWHNNFGHVMSHGCVNAPYDGVEWVYNWANVGTVVEIVE
ncbi:MAG: L,D-transpeptidase family protein [Candidatus Uhrbacteria bacterium]|nr:L,D-transpeptidase family protein [Candidatus Uhrbacteria bacterium]